MKEEMKQKKPTKNPEGHKKFFTLQGLLYNDKFVAAFSVLAALIFWVFTAMTVSPIDEQTLNVPIKVDNASIPEQYKLKMFGKLSVENAKVVIKGKKYIIGNVSSDDLSLTAQTSSVDSAGRKKLNVAASKNYKNAEYDIVSVEPKSVEAYFDIPKEKNMNITPDIVGAQVAQGYYLGNPVLSTDTVKITGPATEVNKVAKVVARVKVEEPLTGATTLTPQIIALDEQGAQVSGALLDFDYGKSTSITVTLPVLKEAVMKTGVQFLNTPGAYVNTPLKVTLSPAQMRIAGAESSINAMNMFLVGSIDFTKLTPDNNEFTFDLANINDVKVLDGNTKVKAVVNMDNMTSRRIDLPGKNMQLVNAPEGYDIRVTSGSISNVRVVGPKTTVKNVKADDLYAILDLSDISLKEGTQTLDVRVDVQNFTNCWAAGQYRITVVITKK